MPIVVTKVGVHMLDAHFMIGSDNRAVEERPRAFERCSQLVNGTLNMKTIGGIG